MSYAEVQKVHDLRRLRPEWAASGREAVLRTVVAIALDQHIAAWCLGSAGDAPISRWPSTLYGVLARAALASPATWRRLALVLDQTLYESLEPYADRSAAQLAQLFLEGRESLTGDELAALLWCLLRRGCPSQDLVAERLNQELEVVAARRLHRKLRDH